MATTNPFYVYTPSFQQIFIDKDTQGVMAGGQVYFKYDNNRSDLKPIYQLTGTPGNYSYVQAENPQTLNMAGAFNQAIYLYPFDPDGNVELYYIEVENANAVPQFQRQAQPNLEQEAGVNEFPLVNFASNGQYSLNNNPGTITHAETFCAPYGWSFKRPAASIATDIVTFQRFSSYITTPPSNPRYAARIRCTNPNPGDTYKSWRLKFPNVNYLASATNLVTLAFHAFSNSGSLLNGVELVMVKNFGTGGSAEEEVPLTTFDFTTSWDQYTYTFIPGGNEGKNIGPDDDDFIAFDVRFPPTSTYDVQITDYLVTPGTVEAPIYPPENIAPLEATVQTGSMMMWSSPYVPTGWIFADGSAQSRTVYSALYSWASFIIPGTTLNGQPTITSITSTENMYVGMQLTCANFSGVRTITQINSATQITVDGNATVSSTAAVEYYRYGAGDGSTTFNVPDMRSGFPIGAGQSPGFLNYSLGQTGGAENVALTKQNLAQHVHTYNAPVFTGINSIIGGGVNQYAPVNSNTGNGSADGLASLPFSIIPPYTAFNFILKT